ncbi:hypothetical protein D6779_00245, partial [Candidatus Parcubacteria bacterium]
ATFLVDVVLAAAPFIPSIGGLKALGKTASHGDEVVKLGKAASHGDEIVKGAEAIAAKSRGKILWESWQNYPKVNRGGRTYAQVGDRLYTRHAVDRLQPSGLGAPAGQLGAGRSISPTFVDDVIRNGQKTHVIVDGVQRTIHTSGTVKVVTEGDIVITVNPWGAP